ncbi:MAG: DUF2029 domain-containing protein [Planctomycetes bacterium]|nr:DUF2029 domain-containing protein [Planctomycetota bacterium]
MSPTTRRVLLLVWSLLAITLIARAVDRKPHRGVIVDHLEFGRRLLHGQDPYAPWRSDPDAPERPLHAPYPPSFGLLTAPFAVLADVAGLRAARATWGLLQVAALIALFVGLRRVGLGRAPPSPLAMHLLFLLALLMGSRFVLRDMHGGGGNLLNLGLCTLAFALAERGQPARGGWLLGLSLATKPTQIWLLPILLLLGHRRTVLHALLAGAVAVVASVALLRGDLAPWWRWLSGSWALATQTDAFLVPAAGFPEFEWMNQSLRCAVARWLGDVPPEFAVRVALAPPRGLGLDPTLVTWCTRALALTAFGAVATVAWRARGEPAGATSRTWVLAAAFVLSVLLSPLSWKAHHVALLPTFVLLLQQGREQSSPRPAWLLLALVLALCGIGGELLGDGVAEVANSLYLVTACDVALLLVTVCLSRRHAAI